MIIWPDRLRWELRQHTVNIDIDVCDIDNIGFNWATQQQFRPIDPVSNIVHEHITSTKTLPMLSNHRAATGREIRIAIRRISSIIDIFLTDRLYARLPFV